MDISLPRINTLSAFDSIRNTPNKETRFGILSFSGFSYFASLAKDSAKNKKGQSSRNTALSNQVGTTRFELATSCTPCKHATGLRYVPNYSGKYPIKPIQHDRAAKIKQEFKRSAQLCADQPQKFRPRHIIFKLPAKSRSRRRAVLFAYTPHHHTQMFGFNNHSYTQGL